MADHADALGFAPSSGEREKAGKSTLESNLIWLLFLSLISRQISYCAGKNFPYNSQNSLYVTNLVTVLFMTEKKDIPCLVLGIGNILWSDEGFGVRAVEAFNRKYCLTDPANKVLDGGTLGMYLYDLICRCENLLIFDCCDLNEPPGSMQVLRDSEISTWTSCILSQHQSTMNHLLQAAALQMLSPKKLTVIGFQPVLLEDYGGSISKLAKEKLLDAVELAAEELKAWGIDFRARAADEKVPLLNSQAVSIDTYEQGRPPEEEAERHGDIRFANIHRN